MLKKGYARQLRKNQTDAENLLWRHLRNRNLNGLKFRRQHPVGTYIIDFYCHELRLAIELDGGQHAEPEMVEYDKERSNYLESQDIKVVRFWNNEIFENMEGVLERVIKCQ